MQQHNRYRFTSVNSLREALRSFKDLEASVGEDTVSATIYLDLKRALGDDPDHPVTVLTKHQRHLVQQYLIEGALPTEVAKNNNIHVRVLMYGIRRALVALMAYLEHPNEESTPTWKPWMFDLMRDPYLTLDAIAAKLGKSKRAISCAMTRYRIRENLPIRKVRQRTPRSESE